MADIDKQKASTPMSPSAEISSKESVSGLGNALSIDDEEQQCYRENFAKLRKLLVWSPDFSIAVTPEWETVIKIGEIPFIMDDIPTHEHEHSIKTWWHSYYELNWLKEHFEKELPTYEEWLAAKESCKNVDALISIINGAGNGFISRNTTTKKTKQYAEWFSFHPFQWDDIYGQYICKRFAGNATKFVAINGENFVSCKRVYRGDQQALSFRPLTDEDVLWYMAKDWVVDVCYTTEQYIKRLNDQIYDAYLRHKPFWDFYTNLTISTPELQKEFMSDLLLVVLAQFPPQEVHISEIIEYARQYFWKFNIPAENIEDFIKDSFFSKDTAQERFSKILWLHNKRFSLLKERISDLQDEYPEYNLEDLTSGNNLNNHDDFYSKKNVALSSTTKPLSLKKESVSSSELSETLPYIWRQLLDTDDVELYKFVDVNNKTLFPYLQICFADGDKVLISRKELKYLDKRWTQIDAFTHLDSNPAIPIVTNEKEFLMDRYSLGKILTSKDTLPSKEYLPRQDDIVAFCERLSTEGQNPWETIIEIVLRLSDDVLANPENVFSLRKIYIPCQDWWVFVSQEGEIEKVESNPSDLHFLVALIKNIVPSHDQMNTRTQMKQRITNVRSQKKTLKRYQRAAAKEVKQQQEEIITVLRKQSLQKKSIQYNDGFSKDYVRNKKYNNLESLPFTSAKQVLANIDIYWTSGKKRSREYTKLLIDSGHTQIVLTKLGLFDEQTVYDILEQGNTDRENILPYIKNFQSTKHQKRILQLAYMALGSKIAEFLKELPPNILDGHMIWTILLDPKYRDIDREKYRDLFTWYLDSASFAYIKDKIDGEDSFISCLNNRISREQLKKIFPLIDINDLWFEFLAQLTKEKEFIPMIMRRFSELKYPTNMPVEEMEVEEQKEQINEEWHDAVPFLKKIQDNEFRIWNISEDGKYIDMRCSVDAYNKGYIDKQWWFSKSEIPRRENSHWIKDLLQKLKWKRIRSLKDESWRRVLQIIKGNDLQLNKNQQNENLGNWDSWRYLRSMMEDIKKHCLDDNFVIKTVLSCKDPVLISTIINQVTLKDLDQSFFLDLLKLIKWCKSPIKVYAKRLSFFTWPFSLDIVNALAEQGYIWMVLKYKDKFVTLPENYFSNTWAKKFIEEKWVDNFFPVINYFHDLSPNIATKISKSNNPEKYKVLYENKAAFSTFPVNLLSVEEAQNCLETYGLETYALCAKYFDDIPSIQIFNIYTQLLDQCQRDTIATYLDFFIDFIPSWIYRSMQRHGYIKVVDPIIDDPTQEKQIRKYVSMQEMEVITNVSATKEYDLPKEGKYIDVSKRWNSLLSVNSSIDDVIEEYDPLCLSYDYFYHKEDQKLSLWDRTIYVVKRTRENGTNFGFDTIYLVDLTDPKKAYVKKIADSLNTQGYITIKNASVKKNDIVVDLSTGSYQEAYQPIVEIRKDIEEIITTEQEQKYIKKLTPFQNQILTEMLLEKIKKDADFDGCSAQRLVDVFKNRGGDMHYFLQNICDDTQYYKNHQEIIIWATKVVLLIDRGLSSWQSSILSDILLNDIDWKKYPTCPLNCGEISKIFQKTGKQHELESKLVATYSWDFVAFANDYWSAQRLLSLGWEKIPQWFSIVAYRANHLPAVKYLIQQRGRTFFQDIFDDIKKFSLDEKESKSMLTFYSNYIKKNNYWELGTYGEALKISLSIQALYKDDELIKLCGNNYLSMFFYEHSFGNTIQIVHYLYTAWALDRIEISKVNPDFLKDIVIFSATYDVTKSYLKKLTEDMMYYLWGTSKIAIGDKEPWISALRFLLTLAPDTFEYFKSYAKAQNYDVSNFINTTYIPSK